MEARPPSPHPRPSLPKNVVAAGWVSFFTDLGSELIYPLLPAFITGTLHASRTLLGLIEGLAEATPAVFRLLAGLWADRVRSRKGLILAGYGISSLFKPLIGFASSAWQVLGLRFVDRIGKGIRTAPRDALIADSTPAGMHGMAFGFHRAMDHLGALGGGLMAWLLMQFLGLSLTNVILFSVVPGLLCMVTIVSLLHEVPGRERPAPAPALSGVKELPKPFWHLLAGAAAFAVANSSDAFLLLRSQEMGVSIASIPLLWSLLHLVKAVTCWYGGRLSDRIGPRIVTAGGWILYSGVYIGFATLHNPAWAWLLFVIYGFFFGATEGSLKAWVASLVPPERRGTAYGVLGLAEGLLLLPASLIAGYLWDTCGSTVPLTVASAVSLLAALWLLLAVPTGKRT